jgi:hypothetical protein
MIELQQPESGVCTLNHRARRAPKRWRKLSYFKASKMGSILALLCQGSEILQTAIQSWPCPSAFMDRHTPFSRV